AGISPKHIRAGYSGAGVKWQGGGAAATPLLVTPPLAECQRALDFELREVALGGQGRLNQLADGRSTLKIQSPASQYTRLGKRPLTHRGFDPGHRHRVHAEFVYPKPD